ANRAGNCSRIWPAYRSLMTTERKHVGKSGRQVVLAMGDRGRAKGLRIGLCRFPTSARAGLSKPRGGAEGQRGLRRLHRRSAGTLATVGRPCAPCQRVWHKLWLGSAGGALGRRSASKYRRGI